MASKIKKNGRIRWVGRVQKQGVIRQKLLDSKTEALAWEAEQRKADWSRTDTDCSLIEWANKYLDYSKRFRTRTYIRKRSAFKVFFSAKKGNKKLINPNSSAKLLSPSAVLEVLELQARNRTPNAANADRKELVAAWNWGIKYLNLPQPNPCAVEKFPEVRHSRYVPPMEDFMKVLGVAKGQDKVMLLTYLHLGARRSEVFRLVWADVDFPKKRIRLSTRKRQDGTLEHDWLPMTDELTKALAWWKQQNMFPGQANVFGQVVSMSANAFGEPFRDRSQFMKGLCQKAGVQPFGFHAIRHLTASTLYEMGQPISVIQVVLRHRSPNTTAQYLKTLGLEETREALDAFSLRLSQVLPTNATELTIETAV